MFNALTWISIHNLNLGSKLYYKENILNECLPGTWCKQYFSFWKSEMEQNIMIGVNVTSEWPLQKYEIKEYLVDGISCHENKLKLTSACPGDTDRQTDNTTFPHSCQFTTARTNFIMFKPAHRVTPNCRLSSPKYFRLYHKTLNFKIYCNNWTYYLVLECCEYLNVLACLRKI